MPSRLLAVLACILLAACASGDGTDTTAAGGDTTVGSGDAAGGGEPVGTITMAGFSFSGPTTVQVGDTIELVNQDEVPHTFTAEDETFDVSISSGDKAPYTFEEPGEYAYFCSIHPSMEGTITVEG